VIIGAGRVNENNIEPRLPGRGKLSFQADPDTDLADPALNTSGVPWSTLYYKDHYLRLQRIKAQWDPRNVFRHALSIRAA